MNDGPGKRSLYGDIFPSTTDVGSVSDSPRLSSAERNAATASANLIGGILRDATIWIYPGAILTDIAGRVEDRLRSGMTGNRFVVHLNPGSVAWHGIPDETAVRAGEPITLDIACAIRGIWADGAFTYVAGDIDPTIRRLVRGAWDAARAVIDATEPGVPMKNVAYAAERTAGEKDLRIIGEAAGHGIGRRLHQKPVIVYNSDGGEDRLPETGMVTVEPVLTTGAGLVRIDGNGRYITTDRRPTAHFEATVMLTPSGKRLLGPSELWKTPPG